MFGMGRMVAAVSRGRSRRSQPGRRSARGLHRHAFARVEAARLRL